MNPHAGTYAASLLGEPSRQARLNQTVGAPEHSYTLSGWSRGQGGHLSVKFFDQFNHPYDGVWELDLPASGDTWIYRSRLIAPPGESTLRTARVSVYSNATFVADSIHFDADVP